MKTYITKLNHAKEKREELFFISYKSARWYLNYICKELNRDGIKTIWHGRDYMVIPSMKIEYRIVDKVHMATKPYKDYWAANH